METPHPGRTLRAMAKEHGVTQAALAARLRVSRLTVNEVMGGRRAITPLMALRLARAFRTTPEHWMDLQRRFDLAVAEADPVLARDVLAIEPLHADVH